MWLLRSELLMDILWGVEGFLLLSLKRIHLIFSYAIPKASEVV
jgi:hypothetical protein